MKRLLCWLAILAMLAPAARADGDFSLSARGACLIDAASGRVLYAQNADARCPMASTTKIMTCMLALELGDPDSPVTASANASGVEGTSIYLSEGETLSLREMLYGLMLRSGNDAAVAVAEHIGGSVPEFVAMMNARAAEIGADAVFANPNGLPAEGHAASALAMARIAREALRIPLFREIVSTRRATIPWVGSEYARVLTNKNRLLTDYTGATGVKTGYTKAAGRCLVFSAERNGMELIGCVLNCPDWFGEAERLLDYGFARYHMVTVLRAGDSAGSAAVTGARQSNAPLMAAAGLSFPLAEGEHYSLDYAAGSAAAPVKKGEILGYGVVRVNGEEIARVPLAAAEDVPEWGLIPALRRIFSRWATTR